MVPGGERRLSPEAAERRGPNPKQQSCALQVQALSDRFCGLAELIHQPHRRLLVAIGAASLRGLRSQSSLAARNHMTSTDDMLEPRGVNSRADYGWTKIFGQVSPAFASG